MCQKNVCVSSNNTITNETNENNNGPTFQFFFNNAHILHNHCPLQIEELSIFNFILVEHNVSQGVIIIGGMDSLHVLDISRQLEKNASVIQSSIGCFRIWEEKILFCYIDRE